MEEWSKKCVAFHLLLLLLLLVFFSVSLFTTEPVIIFSDLF